MMRIQMKVETVFNGYVVYCVNEGWPSWEDPERVTVYCNSEDMVGEVWKRISSYGPPSLGVKLEGMERRLGDEINS